jgi:ABC-type branched-subunit amino acid transport system ATPase component
MGAYTPAARKLFRERLAFVYKLFPILAERSAQYAGTMSGGGQQMCAVAKGLMSDPKLLLMDEPSPGLAGLAAYLLTLQYDVHPSIGLSFGPITFMICVLGDWET